MTKTNAATMADLAPASSTPIRFPDFIGQPQENAGEMIEQAMELIAAACFLPVRVPAADGPIEVAVASEDQNGEVEVVRCREVNRYGKLQLNLLNNVIRSLDYSISVGVKDVEDTKREIRSALGNLARSQDPSRLLDFIEKKTQWSEVVQDQAAFAQMLRDKAADTYHALTGRPYTPYEKKDARASVTVAAPPAAVATDPRILAAQALLNRG